MEFRWQGFNRRFHISLEKVVAVTGVNSNIDDDHHFLMWDFDDIPLSIVLESLENVQSMFLLPEINIINTGKVNGFHAYCFKKCEFRLARTILAATANVDLKYLALGLMRGYFTLRFCEIKGRAFEPVGSLPSEILPDATVNDANCFVSYTKKEKGGV